MNSFGLLRVLFCGICPILYVLLIVRVNLINILGEHPKSAPDASWSTCCKVPKCVANQFAFVASAAHPVTHPVLRVVGVDCIVVAVPLHCIMVLGWSLFCRVVITIVTFCRPPGCKVFRASGASFIHLLDHSPLAWGRDLDWCVHLAQPKPFSPETYM
eukprot:scaffold1906_cov403-Prasinococcus_capsulatus_cf.AAC.3